IRDDEARTAAAEGDADREPEAADEAAAVDGETESQADADADADAEDGDGPVFEVSDRRGSIRVAREGVRFRLDDQEAEFGWDEIGAVETTPARFGRRFTVTVHLSSRRWFTYRQGFSRLRPRIRIVT
ncbi:hypothetical protein JHN57_30150, partial [Streptomyces sp. MBT59]|nr:hypothetical protein [Streptomyces sp. MBT59]